MKYLHVLLVEDDPEDVRSICRILNAKERVSVHFVRTSKEALVMLTKHQFDLIIIDLNLGIRSDSGFSVLQFAKQRPSSSMTPCIIFSSTRRPEEWNRCWRMGANACYLKDIDPDKFDKTVDLIGMSFLDELQHPTYFRSRDQ